MGKLVAHHANETSKGSGVYHVLIQDTGTGKKYNIKVRASGPNAAVKAAAREVGRGPRQESKITRERRERYGGKG